MPNNGAGTMVIAYINNVVKQMKTDLRLIQEQQPLVHNITNYVAMNFVANSLLAIGASPIMARAKEEVEEISSKSNALALNLGVPESTTAHSMILAGEAAMKKRIPIVFDVVGVGATRFRMDIASQIILRCTLQSSREMPVRFRHCTLTRQACREWIVTRKPMRLRNKLRNLLSNFPVS